MLAIAVTGVVEMPVATAGAPPTVRVVTVAELDQPVGFTFTPRGRIVYLERATGRVRLIDPRTGRDRSWFRVSGVNSDGERGALGVELHPRWPRRPWVYVYVTRAPAGKDLRNQLLRLRIRGGRAVALDVLLNSPIGSRSNHNGGRIAFGPDRKLYVVIGDGGENPATAQDLDEVRGKILRLNPDGSVPATNPFGSKVWSYGHRNSFGFAFDPDGGRLWESENGPECNDEINLIVGGGNFGWGPNEDCGGVSPGNTNDSGPTPRRLPKLWFVDTIGITGEAFCDGCGLGAQVEGQLFFGDVNTGVLRRVGLNAARNDVAGRPIDVLDTPGGAIYSMETAPKGRLYFSDARAIYRLVAR